MSKKRAYTKREIETAVLTASARRCALCFGLNHDFSEKAGQIAHVDQDSSNSSIGNLAWLCLEHHDKYDSRTSQSKGYTETELKEYRDKLHKAVEKISESMIIPEANSESLSKDEQDKKTIERAEELYSLVKSWQSSSSSIGHNFQLLLEDRISYNDHMDAIISTTENNPNVATRISMLIDMYFPQLKFYLARTQLGVIQRTEIYDCVRREYESPYFNGQKYIPKLLDAETQIDFHCKILLAKIAEIARGA